MGENELDLFTNEKVKVVKSDPILGKDFNIYGTIEEPLFLAKDVAKCIEYDVSSINKMLAGVDEDEKVRKIVPTLGGDQEMWLLTENGLYEVLMQSRKPIAKEFKKEVKKVLHSLRVNGGYIANQESLTPEQIVANALIVANNIINEMKHRAEVAEETNARLMHTPKTYTATEIAKEVGLSSAQKLNQILKKKGIQYQKNGTWLPFAKYSEQGYYEIKQDVLDNGIVIYNSRITQKGREFILRLFEKSVAVA